MIAGKIFELAAPAVLALAGVAGVTPPALSALSAGSGQYGGPTSPKVLGSENWITLTVAGGALSDVRVDAVVDHGAATCSINSQTTSYDFSKGTLRIEPQGTFGGTLTDPGGDSLKISGRFTDHAAVGSFEIEAHADGGTTPSCSSATITFVASAAGGQVKDARYSGTVGPGYSISLRVSASGNTVDDLTVAIEATCQPGAGSVAPAYDFRSLRITSGAFSGYVSAGDATVSNSIHISGTFFGRVAVGEVSDLAHIKSLPDCTMSEMFTATTK